MKSANSGQMKSAATIKKIREYIGGYFRNIPYNTHHLDHAIRVCQTCVTIGARLDADMAILEAAALLHDIGRSEDMGDKCHAVTSAKIAKDILHNDGWPADKIESITYAIRCHRHTDNIMPKILEAKILQDADRLDALGAIGIARVISHEPNIPLYNVDCLDNPFSGGCVTEHFIRKFLTLRDRMHTHQARAIADKRHNYMVAFLNQLKTDISAE